MNHFVLVLLILLVGRNWALACLVSEAADREYLNLCDNQFGFDWLSNRCADFRAFFAIYAHNSSIPISFKVMKQFLLTNKPI